MSGGYMDYKQYYLDDMADVLEDVAKNGRVVSWADGEGESATHDHYSPDIEQIFLETARKLRELRIYVHRADWLLSGDDGEDSFRKRLKEELEEFNKGEEK